MMSTSTSVRETIFVEEAEVLTHQTFEAHQYVLRLHAPKCAAHAQPGSFAHITCDPAVPMRRPLSIMRANSEESWIELLYKVVGHGLRHLASRVPGERVSVMGPIGKGFSADPNRPHSLLIGGGVGIPPMVFLAERLAANSRHGWRPFVLMGSEVPFPFHARPSTIAVKGVPTEATGCMPLLEGWGVPTRLASLQGYSGCYEGFVTDLADAWLASLNSKELTSVQVFACGPTVMLKAVARLAQKFDLPCQVSLEEFMACAVGGCAGCTVLVKTDQGPAMQRVCVDGPVFDAAAVF